MSTAVLVGRTRSARAVSRFQTRTIRVCLIRAGTRELSTDVPAGTSTEEVAKRLGIDLQGMSLRNGPDAIEATTPLEVDSDILVAPDITAG